MNALTATLPALRLRFGQLAGSWRNLLGPMPPAQPRQGGRTPSLTLMPLQTEFVDTRPGLEVTCLDGCLMLSYDGQQRDIILLGGESHACDIQGRLAMHAFVATELLIH